VEGVGVVGLAADATSAVSAVSAVSEAVEVAEAEPVGEVEEPLFGEGEPEVAAGEPVVAVDELGWLLGVVAGELDFAGEGEDECDCDPVADVEPDRAEGFPPEVAGGALAGAEDVADGPADAWASGAQSDFGAVTAPFAAMGRVTAACATQGMPTESSTPLPTRPAATVRTCAKHIQNVLSCSSGKTLARGFWTTGVACFGTTTSYPLQRQLYLRSVRGPVRPGETGAGTGFAPSPRKYARISLPVRGRPR
jgi:hypothetical protein